MSNNLGSGFFVNFEPNESESELKVINFLEKSGYEASGSGIKKFLIDLESGKNSSAKRLGNILSDNPELINLGIKGLTNIIKKRAGL